MTSHSQSLWALGWAVRVKCGLGNCFDGFIYYYLKVSLLRYSFIRSFCLEIFLLGPASFAGPGPDYDSIFVVLSVSLSLTYLL